MFDKLKASNLSQEAIIQAVRELDIDLVLTAHPTEVTRRTLIHKHVQLNDCLEALELSDLLPRERDKILNRIEQLVNQAWHTNEIREQRRPRWTRPSGASPWWKTACGRPSPNSCAIWTSGCNTTWVCGCRWMPRRSSSPPGWAVTATAIPSSPPR